jgi:BirA family biotin operon repressor/biotin-[acetyl-CoA-carboxylase] ligase
MSEAVEPIELLEKNLIIASLDPAICNQLRKLDVEAKVDSTNSVLQRQPVAEQHAAVILAEQQTTGRGRRGRAWHSPFGSNLYLSLGWMFEKPLTELGCLPLVVAIATARALKRVGLSGHQIKWPNDILLDGRKLCGCLVEMQTDGQGHCHAVLGVGINVRMQAAEADREIEQAWTDLHSQLPTCSRNKLAALLIEELLICMHSFSERGFSPFIASWKELDSLYGQRIEVFGSNNSRHGIACGIDEQGALLLDTGNEIQRFHSGEVSLSKSKQGQ